MITKLSMDDKKTIKSLNADADSGNIKKYIDNLTGFISFHNLDLPTVTDSNSSIVDKHAIIDLYNNYPSSRINKLYTKLTKHPDIEYWYDTDSKFIPLSSAIMKNLVKDTVHYIEYHYNSADDSNNPNINDPIGELRDEM